LAPAFTCRLTFTFKHVRRTNTCFEQRSSMKAAATVTRAGAPTVVGAAIRGWTTTWPRGWRRRWRAPPPPRANAACSRPRGGRGRMLGAGAGAGAGAALRGGGSACPRPRTPRRPRRHLVSAATPRPWGPRDSYGARANRVGRTTIHDANPRRRAEAFARVLRCPSIPLVM